MYALHDLKLSAESNINKHWKYKPISEHTHVLISAFTKAFHLSASDPLKQALASGTIVGGIAPPNGPVTGALCTYAPGSLVVPALNYNRKYVAPTYVLKRPNVPDYVTRTETPWMRKFVSLLSTELDKAWLDWFLQWSGTSQSYGGIAAWVSSVPPAPGPWAAGTVAPLKLHGGGASSSLLMKNLSNTFVSRLRSTSISISIEGRNDPVSVRMLEAPETENIARAVANGISDAFFDMVSQIELLDQTGVAASGVAAPGGVVTGTISGCVLAVV